VAVVPPRRVAVTAAPGPPAGWFPDPSAPDRLRYWDGREWTDHTAVRWLPPQAPAAGTGGEPAEPPAPPPGGVHDWWVCDRCDRTFAGHAEADRHARAEHPEVSQAEALAALRRLAPAASESAARAAAPPPTRATTLGVLVLIAASLLAASAGILVGYEVGSRVSLPALTRPAEMCAREGGRYREGFCELPRGARSSAPDRLRRDRA
jgi:hypothetical protein